EFRRHGVVRLLADPDVREAERRPLRRRRLDAGQLAGAEHRGDRGVAGGRGGAGAVRALARRRRHAAPVVADVVSYRGRARIPPPDAGPRLGRAVQPAVTTAMFHQFDVTFTPAVESLLTPQRLPELGPGRPN